MAVTAEKPVETAKPTLKELIALHGEEKAVIYILDGAKRFKKREEKKAKKSAEREVFKKWLESEAGKKAFAEFASKNK